MSSFRNIDVKAPHIQQLQYDIQLELAKRDYSSPDDPVMAEYIVVMLANQKTPEQITSEMNDLIGAEYDSAFTNWIWAATQQCLDSHTASSSSATAPRAGSAADASASTSASNPASFASRTRNLRQRRSRSPEASASGSTYRAREQRRSRSPTARRANDHRRSRSRSPPSRSAALHRPDRRMYRDYSSNEAWRKSISLRRDDEPPFDGEAFWRSKAEERRRNPPPPAINRMGGPREARIFNAAYGQAVRNADGDANGNAARELFPNAQSNNDPPPPPYQESAGLSIFGRAGIPDPRAAAFVPSSSAVQPAEVVDTSTTNATDAAAPAQSSTSIFARIDPMLPNNQPLPTAAASPNTSTAHSSDFPTQPTETSICRWNVGCTNPMCAYTHASPANACANGDANALVLSQQNCRYGARCTNRDCTRSHVSPAVARFQARSAARVSSNPAATLSMDAALPSQTASRPCRFGAACARADCFFSHPATRIAQGTTPCRFGLGCTRPDCYFTHPPGQRVGGGTSNRLHVFAQTTRDDEMEVVIPGAQQQQQQQQQQTEVDATSAASAAAAAVIVG